MRDLIFLIITTFLLTSLLSNTALRDDSAYFPKNNTSQNSLLNNCSHAISASGAVRNGAASNATGSADGVTTEVGAGSDYLVLTLSEELPIGTDYTIHISGRGGAATTDVWEAPNGTSLPSSQQNSPNGFTLNGQATGPQDIITAVTKTTQVATRYLYFDRGSGDIEIDAVEYCINTCEPSNVTAIANQVTCNGTPPSATPNANASIVLNSVTDGDRYHIVSNGNFSGRTASNATLLSGSAPYTLLSGLANPSNSVIYTIRIYNGNDNNCYTDVTVVLNNRDCNFVSSCDCTEFLYLNEPDAGGIHKVEILPNGNLQEVFGGANNNRYWYPGDNASQLPFPHGFATDVNGYLYINESQQSGSNIRRFTCDGTIRPTSEFSISNTGYKQNTFSIGNVIYNNSNLGPTKWDICTGQRLGQVCLGDGNGNPMSVNTGNASRDGEILMWGLSYNPVTNRIYATSRLRVDRYDGAGTRIIADKAKRHNVWSFTPEEMDAAIASGTCIRPLIGEGNSSTLSPGQNATPYSRGSLMGVVGDNAGNIYVVKSMRNESYPSGEIGMPGNPGGHILKYDANGRFIRQSPIDANLGGGGYHEAIGITYSPVRDRLYVSNFTNNPNEDCIAIFNAQTMSYEGTGLPNPPNGSGSAGKGISITTECCPNNSNQTLNETRCGVAINQSFFLQDFINCNSPICEGTWQRISSSGLSFDACDNSVTINAANASGVFRLQSSGGGKKRCGAFTITLNLDFSTTCVTCTSPDVVVQVDKSEVCPGESAVYTANLSGGSGGPYSYRWQWSADGVNFNNASSTSATHTENAAANRWLRVVVTNGTCTTTSHPVKRTYIANPNVNFNNASICPGESATLSLSNYNANAGYFDLADYKVTVDRRGSLARNNGNVSIPNNLRYASGAGGVNWFDVRRQNNNTGYVDYNFNISEQDWTNFEELSVNIQYGSTMRFQIFTRDVSTGYTNLGYVNGNNGLNTVPLSTNATRRNQITEVKLRFHAVDMGAAGTTRRVHIAGIRVCGNSISWSPSGGSGTTAMVSPNSTTNYTATVRYGDCTQSVTRTVTVNTAPVPVCEYRINGAGSWNLGDCTAEVCVGDRLEVAANPNNLSYAWSGPNGFNGTGASGGQVTVSNSITTAAAGTYTVTITDGNGCTATTSLEVTVNTIPNITSITHVDETCAGSNGSITLNFTDDPSRTGIEFSLNGGATWQSSVNDNSGATTYSNLAPGTYDLRARWGNDDCPINLNNVTIDPQSQSVPNPVCEYNVNNSGWVANDCTVEVCEGDNLRLSANPNGQSYSWSGPNGYSGTGNTNGDVLIANSITAAQAGAYTVTITNGNGCVTTTTINVTVNANPNIAQYYGINGGGLVPGNNVTICDGDEVVFDMLGAFGNNWTFTFRRPDGMNFSGGTNGASNDQIRIPNIQDGGINEGTWRVSYTDPNGCSNTGDFIIDVNPLPAPVCEYNINNTGWIANDCTVEVCEGDNLQLAANPNNLSYAWSGPNGFSGTGGSGGQVLISNSITTAEAGTYIVTVTDGNGCPATTTIDVLVGGNSIVTMNAPSNNGETNYQWYEGTVGNPSAIANANNTSYTLGKAGIYFATYDDVDSCGGVTDYTVLVDDCTNSSVTLNPSPSAGTYQWYRTNGVTEELIAGETNASLTVTATDAAIGYFLRTSGASCNTDSPIFYVIHLNPSPEVAAGAISGTCTDPNTAYLELTSVVGGIKANWVAGSDYSGGDSDFNSPTAVDLTSVSFPFVLASGLPNPTGTQDYTIRVFRDEKCGSCYTDFTVTLNEQICNSTCTGNADSVEPATTGVDYNTGNASAVLGAPDNNYAELYVDTDVLVVDLTDVLQVGEMYSITWRRKTSYSFGPFADMIVEESADGTNWTTNPTQPSTDQQTFITSNLTTTVATRYLRIRMATNSNDDFDLDAISYTDVNCGSCVSPTALANTVPVTCTNNVSNNDGYLQLSSVTNGDAYHWSVGNTFNDNGGVNNYNNATSLAGASYPLQIATGLTNPTGSQNYTIRVYNGANNCFTDVVVTLSERDCNTTSTCNCTEKLYLNDPDLNEVHKFNVNSGGSVNEVGRPWLSNITNPHGFAVDLNGNLYVVEVTSFPGSAIGGVRGPLNKISSDGTVLDGDYFAPEDHFAGSYGSKDGILYVPTEEFDAVQAYSLCDGTELGRMSIGAGGDVKGWGFHMDDTNWYYPDRATGNIYTGSLDTSLYNATGTNSGSLLFSTGITTSSNGSDHVNMSGLMGLTIDDAGNFYIVQNTTPGNAPTTYLRKYSPTGVLLATVSDNTASVNTTSGQSGFHGARDVTYSPDENLLYVGARDNCIAVFNTNLVEQTALNVGNPFNGVAKQISITKECCPVQPTTNINPTICYSGVGDTTIFLQELLSCEGITSSGTWTETSSNPNITFNTCDKSITLSAAASNSCAQFTLTSAGTGANSVCGAYTITADICASCTACTTPTVSASAIPSTCANNTANNDGALQLFSVTSGDAYHWSMGSTFNDNGGVNTYANATSLSGASYPLQIATGLMNPTGSQSYTIRVYNGANDCFTDEVVTMNEQTCIVSCNCKEYIYLNEPQIGSVLKFEVSGLSNFPLTEVVGTNGGTPPNQHWYPGNNVSELPAPHGIATDLNGNLYIGDEGEDANIRRLNCDGQLLDTAADPAVTHTGFSQNMFSIDNTLYVNTDEGPTAYDLCTGNIIGQVCLNDAPAGGFGKTSNLWGLSYNSVTEMVYVTSRLFESHVWVFTRTELEASVADTTGTMCIDPLISESATVDVDNIMVGDQFLPAHDAGYFGIVGDNIGNFYVVHSSLDNDVVPGSTPQNRILKYNTSGAFQAASIAGSNVADGDPSNNFQLTAGITWSEETNYLFIANLTDVGIVDCITAFDAATMTSLGTAVPNPNLPGNNGAKAIGILKECCPVNLPNAFERTIACGSPGETFFLNEEAFDNCDGIVCGSSWTPVSLDGATFEPCNNSVTVTGPGCSVFTLDIGAVSSTNCPAQNATFTICFENETTTFTPTVAEGTCTNGTPNNDATIALTAVINGDEAGIIAGADYTGGPTYGANSNIDVSSGSGTFTNLMHNTQYTIRVYNGSDACFTDVVVMINEHSCLSVFYDWGDLRDISDSTALNDYQTLSSNNGPVHQIISGLSLGATVDAEMDGQPSDNALGDGADEDGIAMAATLKLFPGLTFRLPFSYVNTTGNTAHVEAWIDWNADGAFDGTSEMVIDWDDSGGPLPNRMPITIPPNATTGSQLGWRIRISNQD
ncbi:MAG: GEVED domain-containing protein, partial [Bacteroidota bacterium]